MTSEWLYEQERKDAISAFEKLERSFPKQALVHLTEAQVMRSCSWLKRDSLALRLTMSRLRDVEAS